MEHAACRHLLASLSEYIDGTLGEDLCAELERHLEDCDDCRIVIDSLRKTVSLYQATSEPASMPDDVRQRLFLRLNLDEFLEQGDRG